LVPFQAPVSLAGALQGYLDDPNFEQIRIEHKINKEVAERGTKTQAGKNASCKVSSAISRFLPEQSNS
jgi:hypothetical protein